MGCRSEGNVPAGYVATDSSQLRLRHCTSDRDETGCLVSDEGGLLAEGVHVTAALDCGFSCTEGGMKLTVCTATDCTTHGVLCSQGPGDRASRVHAVGCTMQANGQDGFTVLDEASMQLLGCCGRQNKSAGISIAERGVVDVDSSFCDDNQWGFLVRGVLRVGDSGARGNARDGIYVAGMGRATVSECTITCSGQHGMLVDGEGARIDAERCVVEGNEEDDATAHSFGVLNVVDCVGIESMNNLEIA